jgi:hypothetical protein
VEKSHESVVQALSEKILKILLPCLGML